MVELFTEWLRNFPTIADEMRVEVSFDSYLSIILISLPVSISAYIPRDPSIISLGPVTSANRIVSVGECASCDGNSRSTKPVDQHLTVPDMDACVAELFDYQNRLSTSQSGILSHDKDGAITTETIKFMTKYRSYEKKMMAWTIATDFIIVKCRAYTFTIQIAAIFIVLGGLTTPFTIGNHIQGVDLFQVVTFAWVLAGSLVVMAKSRYVGSVFSMTCFNLQDKESIVPPGFWIYWVVTIPFIVVITTIWYAWEKRRETKCIKEDMDLEEGSEAMERNIMAAMRKRTMSKARAWDTKNKGQGELVT